MSFRGVGLTDLLQRSAFLPLHFELKLGTQNVQTRNILLYPSSSTFNDSFITGRV